jgi:hypothetical protein
MPPRRPTTNKPLSDAEKEAEHQKAHSDFLNVVTEPHKSTGEVHPYRDGVHPYAAYIPDRMDGLVEEHEAINATPKLVDLLAKSLSDEAAGKLALALSQGDQQTTYTLLSLALKALILSPNNESILHNSPNYVKNKDSMELNTQEIIAQAQAQAENTQQQERPAHPEPGIRAILGDVVVEATRLSEILSALEDIPLTTVEAETTIEGLRKIATMGNSAAWQLGLHAVERGLISQAELAKLVGASSATVSRRFHEGTTEEELGRTDVRSNPIR